MIIRSSNRLFLTLFRLTGSACLQFSCLELGLICVCFKVLAWGQNSLIVFKFIEVVGSQEHVLWLLLMLGLDICFLDSILQQNRIAFIVRLLLSEVLLGRGCEGADMPGELGRLSGLAQRRRPDLKAARAV